MSRWSFTPPASAITVERSIQVLIGHEALTDVGAELGELHAEMRVPIMGRREWLEPWIQCYQDFRPLAVLVRAPSGRVDAAALLAERHLMGCEKSSGWGHGAIDHSRPTARNERAAALLGAGVARLVRSGLRPWRFCVAQLPVLGSGDSETRRRPPTGSGGRWAESMRNDQVHGKMYSVELPEKGHRKETRNLLNKASREGLDPSFVRVRDARGVAELLPEIELLFVGAGCVPWKDHEARRLYATRTSDGPRFCVSQMWEWSSSSRSDWAERLRRTSSACSTTMLTVCGIRGFHLAGRVLAPANLSSMKRSRMRSRTLASSSST